MGFLSAIGYGLLGAAGALFYIDDKVDERKLKTKTVELNRERYSAEQYREAVIDRFGIRNAESIRLDTIEKEIHNNPPSESNTYKTKHGTTLCYDGFEKRYFISDIELIRKSVRNLEGGASQNDFYRLIGLPETQYGDRLGWPDEINVNFFSIMADTDKTVFVLFYSVEEL